MAAVEKAKESCKNAGQSDLYHFVDAKKVSLGSDAEREIEDILLSISCAVIYKKKISKVGNSLALLLPEGVKRLGI